MNSIQMDIKITLKGCVLWCCLYYTTEFLYVTFIIICKTQSQNDQKFLPHPPPSLKYKHEAY